MSIFGVVAILLFVWGTVALPLWYALRWRTQTSMEDRIFIALIWPALLVVAPLYGLYEMIFHMIIPFVASRLDRLIYLATRHVIDRSEYGVLWEGRMPYGRHVEVEVADSVGTYLIAVDPSDSIQTAKQAVAWTYGMSEEKFRSVVRV